MFIVDYTLTGLQRAEKTCNKCQIDLNAIACMRIQLLFIYYYTSYGTMEEACLSRSCYDN